MSHTSIDRCFLLVTLTFEDKLIDSDGLINVLLELIKTRDLNLALASQQQITEEKLRDLEVVTDSFIRNYDGSVDHCFRTIDEEIRSQILDCISPCFEKGLARYKELLENSLDGNSTEVVDGDLPKEGESGKITALIKKAEFKAGRFHALRQIDSDGMGLINKGLDDEIIRYVAIKTTKTNSFHNLENLENRLRREAKIHGRLEHPNILPVYDAGVKSDGMPYIVLPKIDMGTLGEAIARFHAGKPLIKPADSLESKPEKAVATHETPKGPLNFEKLSDNARSDFRDLLGRFVDVCNAMQHVHSKGFLHRDLKPANVMVGNHAETFVIDFGLACLLKKSGETQNAELADDPDLIHEGIAEDDVFNAGTPEYKAPEQYNTEFGELDQRTDTYALGLILCEILTGKRPFEKRIKSNENALPPDLKAKLRIEAIREGLGNLREKNPTIPRPLQAICQKAVAFEQKDRYQSALELGDDVENWLANEPVTSYIGQELVHEKAVRWARKHPTKAASLIATALIVTICIGLYSRIYSLRLENLNLALREEYSKLELESKTAEVAIRNKEISTERIAKLEESRKLTMYYGSWSDAIKTIEELEQLYKSSDLKSTRSKLIDLRLDKLKALDGGKPGPRAAAELNKILADYAANPADFSKSQIGRLFVYKGDIRLEALKPGEKSPYAVALQYLEEKDLAYNYARGMTEPNPEKAVAYMDAAAGLDPYSLRPLLVSTFIKLMQGRTTEALTTLKERRTIMPEDDNIFLVEKLIEVNSFNKPLFPDDKTRVHKFLKDQGAEEAYAILFELFPKIIQGNYNKLDVIQFSRYWITLINNLQNDRPAKITDLFSALVSNPPEALGFFNRAFSAFTGLQANDPAISLILILARAQGTKLPPVFTKEQAIEEFKQLVTQFPIQELAIRLLMVLIEDNRLQEAANLMDHYPERSLVLNPKDRFFSVMSILTNYFAKILTIRRVSIDPLEFNRPFLNQTIADSMRQLISKLAKDIPFQNDQNLSMILMDTCEFLNDPDLALAILKTASPVKPIQGDAPNILMDILEARSNPEKAIEYLEKPNSIKGDLWAALWIKIHRDYPELARKHPKLNEMPENPFMPTSIDYPLPLASELNEMYGSFTGKAKPTTPVMMPSGNKSN